MINPKSVPHNEDYLKNATPTPTRVTRGQRVGGVHQLSCGGIQIVDSVNEKHLKLHRFRIVVPHVGTGISSRIR